MWQVKNKQLYQKFEFKDFNQAWAFMQAVAEVAVSLDHHPTWTNSYNKVEIWLSTHSAGKVTEKDRKLSGRIDRIYETMGQAKMTKMKEVNLYTDGGARGNPGPAACAFAIYKMDNSLIKKSGFYAGSTTNNQAEYRALKLGLDEAKKRGAVEVHVFLDSLLVVNQMKGVYKIKNRDLWPIHQAVLGLVKHFKNVNFTHVPREYNKLADGMVNQTLDAQEYS